MTWEEKIIQTWAPAGVTVTHDNFVEKGIIFSVDGGKMIIRVFENKLPIGGIQWVMSVTNYYGENIFRKSMGKSFQELCKNKQDIIDTLRKKVNG